MSNAAFEIKYNLLMTYYGLVEDYIHSFHNRTHLRCKSNTIAVLTGGTRGIGVEIVKMLLGCDMKILLGCRNIEDGKKVEAAARKEGITHGQLECYKLDLESIESVKEFAKTIKEKYPKINYLINNAAMSTNDYITTKEGVEINLFVNNITPLLLIHLLLPNLIAASTDTFKSRIVNTTSSVHHAVEIDFDDINNKNGPSNSSYSKSKLAQLLCLKYLAKKFQNENTPVLIYGVHPGCINTDMQNNSPIKKHFPIIMKVLFKHPKKGAMPVVYTVIEPKLENKNGAYISNCRILPISKFASFEDHQKIMYLKSLEILGIKEFGKA